MISEVIITGAFRAIWDGLDWSYLTDYLPYVIAALICIPLHETCHGLVAYKLGDPTAKQVGRLTLNPFKHIDWVGLVMMVIFHVGWAKPVPVNPRYFKNPKRDMAITAIAGPASNLLLALVILLIYGFFYYPLYFAGTVGNFVMDVLVTTAYLSTSLAIFNLIPISPLDGSKVLYSVLSDEAYFKVLRYERFGMILMVILVATGLLGTPLSKATGFVFDKLFNIAVWADGIGGLLWR